MKRPVRIAHVWSSDMGLSLSLPYLLPLLARGWEVTGVCPPGPRLEAVRAAGVRWLPHPLERRLDPLRDLEGARHLYRMFRALRPDIVHTHNAKVGLVGRVTAVAARVPIVVHTHHGVLFDRDSPAPRRTALAAMERLAGVGVARLFVQSEEDQRTLVATGAAAADKVELIGNGVDLERFAPTSGDARAATRRALGIGDGEVLFLSAGRIVREKGFVELFEAARRARVRLAVAGPVDREKDDVVDEVTLARARAGGVLLLGERGDMPDLYAAADVVVLCSWREGLPRVLMEGAAAGRPLVASDVRGCREVVSGPEVGLLVPPRNPAALAEVLARVAADAGLRARLGAAARVEAERRFDLRRVVARVEAAYMELLAAHPPRSE